MPSLLLTPSFRAFLGGVLGASIGVQETMLITAIAPLFSVLWLIWSPVIRQGALPEPTEDPLEAEAAEPAA
jgi:hypothetical protein